MSAKVLDDYLEEYETLGERTFLARNAVPVFVKTSDPELNVPSVSEKGRSFETRAAAPAMLLSLDGVVGSLRTDAVFPIRKRSENAAFPDRIGIGRATNTDLVIALPRVSKYHAFVQLEGDDVLLTDARSTFGTSVDGNRLEPLVAVRLTDGALVGFGPYHFRFHTAVGLVSYITRLNRVRARR